MPADSERQREAGRVTWVSVGVNVVLTLMQLLVGLWAHSQSLIADAMHTFSDIVADGFVLYANRKGSEAADEAHPYGHGRIETAASLVLGLLLAGTGGGILIMAVERLQNLGSLPPVGVAAMWAAVVTLLGKEGLFRYMLAVAERLRSPMLIANAWHARADALSSLVVAAGIAGALAGFGFADAAAAIVVGAMIVKAGVGFAWGAMSELIDTGLSQDEVDGIHDTLAQTPGVINVHDLRTRRMAQHALVDVHIQVSPRISVSEGHLIAEMARIRLLKAHPDVLDALVHVDVEDDMDPANRSARYPDRQTLLDHLSMVLGEDMPPSDQVTFHFLGARVEADVILPDQPGRDDARLEEIRRRVTAKLEGNPWLARIHLHTRIAP